MCSLKLMSAAVIMYLLFNVESFIYFLNNDVFVVFVNLQKSLCNVDGYERVDQMNF